MALDPEYWMIETLYELAVESHRVSDFSFSCFG
uniref:Uncharacterized protein n=1 Tax=Rhizophora mucronata TaxID=61149 RepID=A0A2P2PRC9_RHIMU